MKKSIWALNKRSLRRFMSGHPWVFANELAEAPQHHSSGHPVELRSPRGEFLAYGYGNTNSLIVFRALSRSLDGHIPWSEVALTQKVFKAVDLRKKLGLGDTSCRLIYGEGDELPGLVIDRFTDGAQQVLVCQLLTAGIEALIADFPKWVHSWIEKATGFTIAQTTLILRRDTKNRQQEGLEILPPQVVGPLDDNTLKNFKFKMGDMHMTANLASGQKTGFFFDQKQNTEKVVNLLLQGHKSWPADISVADLFCHLGQWGAQIARGFTKVEKNVTVHLVDSSASALELAQLNVKPFTKKVSAYCLDVMEGIGSVPDSHIIICDPPAFVKSKKDLEAGLRGYVKVNAMAMDKLLEGGLLITCSCSQHVSEEDFLQALHQAQEKAGRKIRWVMRGEQAADHPLAAGFPEGQYLKCWVGVAV